METKISKLEEDKAGLEKEVSDLKRSCEMIEKRAAEQKVCIHFKITYIFILKLEILNLTFQR